ncbi:hypothetical protein OVA29_05885 [Exiguobacterium sp. SL14]|nr:histidine kinase dimerization/phospho-acceptor domain-containing protein [Exiguobacterium sp. SL14]MCY1690349.1 hypothetical protein [Exiguobacterium sp. SL14]
MVSAAPIFDKNGRVQGTTVVFNDITEIKKLEQMRKDFVANVSHELKTPLTSIKGFAETLLDGAQDVPEIREQFLRIIHDESERMQTLVEDLLELSRLEQDNYQLETAIVDVTSLVRETASTVASTCRRKRDDDSYRNRRRSIHSSGFESLKTSCRQLGRECTELHAKRRKRLDST